MTRLALASLPAGDSPEALPLGAACVAAAVLSSPELRGKVEPVLVELPPGAGPEAIASRIASTGAGLVGFSTYVWSRRAFCTAAALLRGRLPGAFLFAGGPEATADPAGLAAEGGLDFAVAGEGESATVAALRELVAARAAPPLGEALSARLAAVPGVYVPGIRAPEGPFRRAPAEDPARLASPWLSGAISPEGRGGDLLWELTRGCPYRCAYCYESKGEPGARRFPLARIEAELALFVRSGARYVFVLDPTFNADRERARKLLGLMRRAPGIRWKLELRAELLDEATVEALASLDCIVQVGLQSSRPETMAAIGRGFDRGAFARGARMLDRAGVDFGIDLIYGLPGDALGDFEASLDYALGFGPNHLDLFPLAVLPGTELGERAVELGVEADPEPPYLVRGTRELGAEGVASAAALAAAADRFYSAGRAVGWFRAALAPLGERPSAFLRRFGEATLARPARAPAAVPGAAPAHAAIEAEQLAFLEESYRRAGAERLWPALRDLVRLHGAMSRALAEGEGTALDLEYDPDDILAAAGMGLRRFVAEARRLPTRARIAPDGEEGLRVERLRASPAPRGSPRRRPR